MGGSYSFSQFHVYHSILDIFPELFLDKVYSVKLSFAYNNNNVQSAGLSPPLCGVSQVCDLLDLLGGSEQPLQPSPALGSAAPPIPVSTPNTVGGDLLDLLGGLEPTPITPGLTFTYTHNELQKQETGRDF